MRIAGAYEYWRSLCWTIRKKALNNPKWISEEEWGTRDISNHELIMTETTINNYAVGYADGYAKTDWFHEVMPIILDTCCFDDIEFQKLRRNVDADDNLAARFIVATMVRFVLLNIYKSKRASKRLIIGS